MNPLAQSGTDVIASIRKQTDTVLLAFSCGKDSIAAWLEIRKHFPRVIPFYLYLIPDLEFIEKSLAYYENWFDTPIVRMPNPALYRMLNACVFQAPENQAAIDAMELPIFEHADVYRILREQFGLAETAYCATGVRAVDSPLRMVAIKRYGAVNRTKLHFYPIWDWNKERLLGEIRAAGVKLPVDYRVFGRSFDGIDYRFLEPMRRNFPRDYARVLEYFPLADLEFKRREYGQEAAA